MPTTLIPMSPSSAAPSRASATGTSATGTPIDRLLNAPEKLLFASTDLDEVRSMVGRVMKPHQLTRTAGGERLDARMHYTGLGDLSLSRLRYGATVRIEPGPLESFFLVQMPLCGTAAIESGGQRIDSSPELASVLSPECDTRMCWRPATTRSCCASRARWSSARWSAIWAIRWTSRCISSWASLARLRALELPAVPSGGLRHPISRPGAAQAGAVAGRATGRLDPADLAPAQLQRDRAGARSSILPRHVRRAQDYLQAHAHEPLSVEQLAQVAGVSVRSLYSGFKEFLGVSPMHHLRDLRMERARTELLSGEAASVAGVALRWGFAHMGRFSNDYKARYLETPSQTLRRH